MVHMLKIVWCSSVVSHILGSEPWGENLSANDLLRKGFRRKCQGIRKQIQEGEEAMQQGAHPSLTHRELCSIIRMRQGSWAFSHSPSVVVVGKWKRKLTGSSGSWCLRVAPLARGCPQNKQSLNKQLGAKFTEASGGAYSYGSKDPKGPGGADSISYNIGVCRPLILSTCL